MRAGKLNRLITVQTPAPRTADGSGEMQPGWAAFASVWARIESLAGKESIDGGVSNAQRYRLHLRYLAGVTHDMRVQLDGRVFEIEGISDIEDRHRELRIECVQVF